MAAAAKIPERVAAVVAAHRCMAELFPEPLRVADAAGQRLRDLAFTVKDVVKVRDSRLTAGLGATLVEAGPGENPLVSLMLAQGASCLGIAASAELAFDLSGEQGIPAPLNPRGVHLQTGGSSSGSAVAVALGFGDFSIATDTGGSSRVPAACCGVIGFKPGRGRLPTEGTVALSETCDHLGVIARDFDILDRVLNVQDATFQAIGETVGDPVVGVSPGYLRRHLSVQAMAWFDDFCRSLTVGGVRLRNVDLDFLHGVEAIYATIVPYEAFRRHGSLLDRTDVTLSEPIRSRLESAARISSEDHAAALCRLQRISEQMAELSKTCPMLLLPTLPEPAPVRGQRTTTIGTEQVSLRDATLALTAFANLAGAPAVAFPVETVGHGSQSAQLVGLRENDGDVLAAARRISTISAALEQRK